MKLKLTLARAGDHAGDDLVVDIDAETPVAALARALAERDPRHGFAGDPANLMLRIDSPGTPRMLAPDRSIGDAAVRSGDTIALVTDTGRFVEGTDDRAAAATLVIEEGPDAGSRYSLRGGASHIGRDPTNEVVVTDAMVSKRHARINVADRVEIIDLGSINGIEVGGALVPRAVLRPGERVRLGDTVLAVKDHRSPTAVESGNSVAYNRSPYLDPHYPGHEIEAPEVPEAPKGSRLPWLAMVMPLLFGIVMYAFTQQILSVVFVALSPIMMLGTYFSTKSENKRNRREAVADFRAALATFEADLDRERQMETAVRCHEHPSAAEVLAASRDREPLLWARRPDRPGFLEVRLGVAALPSRSPVVVQPPKQAIPELFEALRTAVAAREDVAPVPVSAALPALGALGIAGPRAEALRAARSVLTQLTGLHSPTELVLAVLVPGSAIGDWDWLKWLPHTAASGGAIGSDLVGADGVTCGQVMAQLTEVVAQRRIEGAAAGPAIVVLIDDEAPVDRPRLVELAETGRELGIYVVWVAATVPRLPAACAAYIDCYPPPGRSSVGFLEGGLEVVPIEVDVVDAAAAMGFARDLAPVVDAGASTDEASEVPSRVSFLTEVGLDLAERAEAVVDRWRQSDSLPDVGGPVRRRRNQTLSALVGAGPNQPMQLDLRTHGPHALVGGTTGAGKSEFLQTWVIGLATNYSPARVTFLFVDYKGGAAFSECVHLPHTVGLVTDLTPHLVHRALRSLNAELRHREHILNKKKAKDLLELEARGDPEAPPSLVIVVDEFAALATEVPEFVDGVVNVAQRGRSLGLHLILATQRPSGVIQGNLRANTNLRVALRMADEADSMDVVDEKTAATFDPALPGRGVAKIGPGRLHLFQTAYVGGWTRAEAPPIVIDIHELGLGARREWEKPAETDEQARARLAAESEVGPTDLHRLVVNAGAASTLAALPAPRQPWLPELAEAYDLAKTPQSRTDTELIFGICDDPDAQAQLPIAFRPDVDGNMCVIGTGGSGKSGFLRTLAVAAGLTARGGPCHVYGLDFGARGLDMLEALPHVGSVVSGDDDERVSRLLRTVSAQIDERAGRYAAVRAGSITEYRELAGEPEEPRILLLVDGFQTFRQEYESGPRLRLYERFQAIATDGRQVGVHVVIAADRVGSIPSALGSTIQRRLVLRLASENDYAMVGVDAEALAGSPPGRGFLDGRELQIAVLGGSANTASQAAAMQGLARAMGTSMDREPAPPVGRLAASVALTSLPSAPERDHLVIGLADETLGAAAVLLNDPILVVGPPRSGKTTALVTIAEALRRDRPVIELVYIGDGRSELAALGDFDRVVITDGELEQNLADLVSVIKAAEGAPGSMAVFFEDAPRLSGLPQDPRLVEVFEAAARTAQIVVADGETSASVSSSWGLMKSLKASRHGIALIPDQYDGDALFKTPFPPTSRKDYPPGRGLYVRSGRVSRLQLALPGLGDAEPSG